MLSWLRNDLLKITQSLTPTTFVFFWFLNVEFLGGDFTFVLLFFWVFFSVCDVILLVYMNNSKVTYKQFLIELAEKMSLVIWFFFIIMFMWAINYKIDSEWWSKFIGIICIIGIILGTMWELKNNTEKRIVITGNTNSLLHKVARILFLADKVINYSIEKKGKKYLDGVRIKNT
jgi:small-conductance mechanosensitive channel